MQRVVERQIEASKASKAARREGSFSRFISCAAEDVHRRQNRMRMREVRKRPAAVRRRPAAKRPGSRAGSTSVPDARAMQMLGSSCPQGKEVMVAEAISVQGSKRKLQKLRY